MKKIITLLFALATINTTFAQGHFELGSNVIGLGIGIGSRLGGFTYGSQTPALSVQYEHGMWSAGGPGVISLGGFVGIKSYKYDYNYIGYDINEKWSYTVIGVRSAYHYNGIKSDQFDVYGGAMLSYDIVSYTYDSNVPNSYNYNPSGSYGSALGISLFVGGRYYFNDQFAGFAELGYGVAYLNLGLCYKF